MAVRIALHMLISRTPRHELIECVQDVITNGRVGPLIDRDSRCRMGDIDRADPVGNPRL